MGLVGVVRDGMSGDQVFRGDIFGGRALHRHALNERAFAGVNRPCIGHDRQGTHSMAKVSIAGNAANT